MREDGKMGDALCAFQNNAGGRCIKKSSSNSDQEKLSVMEIDRMRLVR